MNEAVVVKSLEDLYKLIGNKEFECFLRLKNGKYKKFTKWPSNSANSTITTNCAIMAQ